MGTESFINYDAYIRSPQWQAKRIAALRRANHCCQLCKGNGGLAVHHNDYSRLGYERDDDLIVLCQRCHEVFHAIRDPRTREKAAARAAKEGRTYGKHVPVMPALPATPPVAPPTVNAEAQRLPMALPAAPAPIPPGRQVTIQIDRNYVESLISRHGGLSRAGAELLGYRQWPPPKGWRRGCVGTTVTVDQNLLDAELVRVVERRDRLDNPQPAPVRPARSQLSEETAEAILAALEQNVNCDRRKLAERLGCTKGDIRHIHRSRFVI